MMDLSQFAYQIKNRRRELGLMAKSVARMAGISRSYLSALESGRNPSTGKASQPSERVIERLASVLDLDADHLNSLAGYSVLQTRVQLKSRFNKQFELYIRDDQGENKLTNPVLHRLVAYLEEESISTSHRMLLHRQIDALLDWLDDFSS